MPYRLRTLREISALELIRQSGIRPIETRGNMSVTVRGNDYLAALSHVTGESITFAAASPTRTAESVATMLASSGAGVVLLDSNLRDHAGPRADQLFVVVDRAREMFVVLSRHVRERYEPEYLTRNELPESSPPGANVLIERGAIIGEQVELTANLWIGASVQIGDRTTIKPGSVIGADGFGMVRFADGTLHNFPFLGGVIIGSDVSIGSCVVIDRANFGKTLIHRGAKLDNLTYVAHNAAIGEDAIVTANVTLLGQSEVGNRTRIAPSVSILQGVRVGSDVVIGMGATVVSDVPDDMLAVGLPAKVRGRAEERHK